MSIKCKGCGIGMQYEEPQQLGYSPKVEADYCQRCYRLKHYDDLNISMKHGIDEDQVMEKMRSTSGLIVWVVDCFDFESSFLSGMNRHFLGRDILLVATKYDLLPTTLSEGKLERFIMSRLKEMGIQIVGLALVRRGHESDLNQLRQLVEVLRDDRDVLFMGKANAGKSTLLNQFLKQDSLTVARYPGTTLEFNEVEMAGWKIMDTPGLSNHGSLLLSIDDQNLKTVIPDHCVKPQVFQTWQDQSYAIGGLCRIDCQFKQKGSAVFYLSQRLSVHRGKIENADGLWQNHQGTLLQPSVAESVTEWKTVIFTPQEEKCDVAISGLGWVCISQASQIHVQVPSHVQVTFRKAMI